MQGNFLSSIIPNILMKITKKLILMEYECALLHFLFDNQWSKQAQNREVKISTLPILMFGPKETELTQDRMEGPVIPQSEVDGKNKADAANYHYI